MKSRTNKLIPLIGVCLILGCVGIAWLTPEVAVASVFQLRLLAALGAACASTILPGNATLKFRGFYATRAVAVAIVVFIVAPIALPRAEVEQSPRALEEGPSPASLKVTDSTSSSPSCVGNQCKQNVTYDQRTTINLH